MSEDLVPRDELQAAISARKELDADMEPALVDAFVERIEKRLAERQGECEQSLRRKREHQKETVLGAMALPSSPSLRLAGLAGVIVVCGALVVIDRDRALVVVPRHVVNAVLRRQRRLSHHGVTTLSTSDLGLPQ